MVGRRTRDRGFDGWGVTGPTWWHGTRLWPPGLAWLHRKEPPPFLRAHLMSQLSRSQTTVVQSIAPPHIPANPIIFSLASTEIQKYTKTEKDKNTKYKHRQIQSIAQPHILALAIISSLQHSFLNPQYPSLRLFCRVLELGVVWFRWLLGVH